MSDDPVGDLRRRLRWGSEREPEIEPGGGRPYPAPAEAVERWDDEAGARTAAVDLRTDAVSFEQRELDRMEDEALDRRRQLWRDTAVILSAIIAALLVANFVFPTLGGTAVASPTPNPTEVVVGPTDGLGDPGGATDEPILDPSLGIDASLTPGPARTLPPTGSAAPTRPGFTALPTIPPAPTPTTAPTPTPTPTPTPEPTPPPTPTPIPPPSVKVTCTSLPALTVTCSAVMTDGVAGSQVWDMEGSGTLMSGGDGSSSITFIYDAEGTYHVVVTITGLDGSSISDGTDVTASPT